MSVFRKYDKFRRAETLKIRTIDFVQVRPQTPVEHVMRLEVNRAAFEKRCWDCAQEAHGVRLNILHSHKGQAWVVRWRLSRTGGTRYFRQGSSCPTLRQSFTHCTSTSFNSFKIGSKSLPNT